MLTAALLDRFDGPDRPQTGPPLVCELWTVRDVERWLVAAFASLPGKSLLSPVKGQFQGAAGSECNPGTFDWLGFSSDVLGRGSRERLALLTWARVEAQRRAGHPGGSVSEFCREMGWSRKAFYARRDLALARLACARSRLGWE